MNTLPVITTIVFDLDGTTVINGLDSLPSQAVIDAVAKAKQYCTVSIATGRPLWLCQNIIDMLGIDDLCILNGGSHLYSQQNKQYVWKQELEVPILQQITQRLLATCDYTVADEFHTTRTPLSQYRIEQPVGLFCLFELTEPEIAQLTSIINTYSPATSHPAPSWKPGLFDLHITHQLATKKHALESLLARLKAKHQHVMVIGDGGNDLPLFELAGLKVAMGNAAPALKAAADWVAPSVDQDGLAIAINNYILDRAS